MKLLSVVLALFATSCSFLFSRPPDRTRPLPLCQPRYVAPVMDTSQAIGAGVLALATLGHASNDQYESEADTFALIGALFAAETALFAASAAHGFKHARACRELREEVAGRGPMMWIAPSMPPGALPAEGPVEGPPVEVEQQVDVNEDEVDIRTTIRRTR